MRIQHLNQFYELLSRLEIGLGRKYRLERYAGKIAWANRGVYFFFEPSELRNVDESSLRVVRIGTHAVSTSSKTTLSKRTLWNRLSEHRGSSTGGDHRVSVFRHHVGAAFIKQSKQEPLFPEWDLKRKCITDIHATQATEKSLELKVSEYIGRMTILFLAIEDESSKYSDRAYIEKNSIALLSGCHGFVDPPSNQWLGGYSPKLDIRSSGLWNLDYVWGNYDSRFLDVMAFYVDVTLGIHPKPANSMAPADWHQG